MISAAERQPVLLCDLMALGMLVHESQLSLVDIAGHLIANLGYVPESLEVGWEWANKQRNIQAGGS